MNIKIIPRVYLHWSGEDKKFWPDDMQTDDYESEQFRRRVLRLIERLGILWDNDPRVAYVEMGLIGKWGEHDVLTGGREGFPQRFGCGGAFLVEPRFAWLGQAQGSTAHLLDETRDALSVTTGTDAPSTPETGRYLKGHRQPRDAPLMLNADHPRKLPSMKEEAHPFRWEEVTLFRAWTEPSGANVTR